MSYIFRGHLNKGAYEQPFSGVGIPYDPLGTVPDRAGLILHESGFLPDNSDWNFPAVFSPFWRVIYNFEPGHRLLFEETVLDLRPDYLVLIPPHCLFHCQGQHPVPCLWINFSFVHQLHPEMVPPILLPSRNTELCLIEDLKSLIAVNECWQPTDAILRCSLALLHVVLSRPELRWQPPVSPTLERVRRFIEGSHARPLGNPELAKLAGMAVSRFIPAFLATFGSTPARYVAEVRVREAARMLVQSDASIDEIAEQTGFPNRAYFSRVFRKITRDSPAAFRKRRLDQRSPAAG